MSNDINLSAAIRSSLVSLQSTQTLVNRTQNDLSTGLKVNNAIDNPVAFFQAQALSDRASDFANKKDSIDQGISSLSTSLQGVTSIENVVGQLQGLVLSAQSASTSQVVGLVNQFNSLRSQINTLALDTSYQGLNLINGTGQTLTVTFSTLTASNLTVKSVNETSGPRGLAVVHLAATGDTFAGASGAGHFNSGFQISYPSTLGGKAGSGSLLSANSFYFSGTATQFKSGDKIAFKYGTLNLTITIGSAGSLKSTFTNTQLFHDGDVLHFRSLAKSGGAPTTGGFANGLNSNNGFIGLNGVLFSNSANGYTTTAAPFSANGNFSLEVYTGTKLNPVTGQFILNPSLPSTSQKLLDLLQANLGKLRADSETIGSNVALLNTRLDFTNQYINLLQGGSGKLTLADLNEEGADLLSLQTRQQLGIQALSFAGQNERAVLSLFR